MAARLSAHNDAVALLGNTIATGVVAATRELGLKIPLVVRLEGNNVAAGKKTLAESGLKIDSADTMADAAQKIVKLVA